MSLRSSDVAFERRDFTGDGVSRTKRRKKTNAFVEYQPSDGSLKKVPSGKQKLNPEPRRNLSCAECRRLKLKCDRVFPCRACVRRGCQGICPNGSLVSGKGTRYVLANTERLHKKISAMSERILELEEALQTLYEEHRICLLRSRHGGHGDSGKYLRPPTHPLLVGEKLLVKGQLELYGEVPEQESPDLTEKPQQIDGQLERSSLERLREDNEGGKLCHDSETGARALRTTVGVLKSLENQTSIMSSLTIPKLAALFWPVWKKAAHGASAIAEMNDVPFGDSNLQLAKSKLLGTLPSRDEAERLCSVARDTGFFILNYILTNADLAGIISNVYEKRSADISMVNAGLLFIMIGVGIHMDYSSSEASYNPEVDETVEYYVSRSRAAMALHALGKDVNHPSNLELRAVQYHFLFMLVLVLLSLRGQDTQKKTDAMDVLVSLVKHTNLHTERSYSKYTEKEQDDRRFLLYEILSVVGETCLAQDLPMPLSSVDVCHPLSSRNDADRFPSGVEAEYYNRRRDFYVNCLKPILDLRSIPPSNIPYSDILELDCKIRTFPFPPAVLQDHDAEPTDIPEDNPFLWRRLKLLRFLSTYRVNTLLLHLHRRFMQQCLSSKGSVLAHLYFASVVASCRSAWIIIRNTDSMHRAYPELVNRLGLPWYNVLCAATANFILLERVPYCPLAPYCLRELNRAADVIERASTTSSEIAGRASPIVRQFVVRGTESLRRWKEALEAALDTNVRLHARADYCAARFDAMVNRIKQVGSSASGLSIAVPSSNLRNDPIKDELEIWDIAHPEIGEVLTMLPSCVLDQCTGDEMLWETVHMPLNNTDVYAPSMNTPRPPLMELFDALDDHLRQRPDFILSTLSNDQNIESPDVTDALRDMFPDDVDLDWATLTDALVAAPQDLMSGMSGPGWTGLRE
ncbi:hypothetical protein ACEPAI_7409 [Sanghuangporus weigelae]